MTAELTRSVEPTVPMRLREAAIVLAISGLVVALGTYVGELVLTLWWFGYVTEPGSYHVLDTHTLTAWLGGGLLPGILGCVVLTGRFTGARLVRIVAGGCGLACLVLAIATVIVRPTDHDGEALPLPILNLVLLAAGIAAAWYVAARQRLWLVSRRMRASLLASTVVVALALGGPTLIETHAEYRSQELRPFTIEIVAAYPAPDLERLAPGQMPTYVIDSSGSPGEPVELGGRRFFVHRDDRLVIPAAKVRRVRWLDSTDDRANVSIRIDEDAGEAMRVRSERRMSQFDALYIDGVLVAIPLYEGVVSDRLGISDHDPVALRRIYDLLAVD